MKNFIKLSVWLVLGGMCAILGACKDDGPKTDPINNLFRPVFVDPNEEDSGEMALTWRWYQVNGAVAYTFQISASNSENNDEFLAGMIHDGVDMQEAWTFTLEPDVKRYTVAGLNPETNYYARIKSVANNPANDSQWSYAGLRKTAEYTGDMYLYLAGTTTSVPDPHEWEYDGVEALVIDVSTNRDAFTVTFDPQDGGWLTYDIDQSAKTITLTPSGENPDGIPRSVSMTVGIDDGVCARTISLVQKKKTYSIALSVSEMVFDNSGNVISVNGAVSTVTTNADNWTVSVAALEQGQDVSWCTANPPSGTSGGTVTVSAATYTGAESRSADVVVTVGSGDMLVSETIRVTQTGNTVYAFQIPDFSGSFVYKVLDGQNQQIAEVCREYLRTSDGTTIDAQAIVVYPMLANGKADITKGYVAQVNVMSGSAGSYTFSAATDNIHGGRVAFDKATNSISSYTAGTSAAPVKVIVNADGTFANDADGSTPAENLATEPYLLVDVRGTETISYKLTKIGAQYWLAENYRSRVNKDGSPIPFFWFRTVTTTDKPTDNLYADATEYATGQSATARRKPGMVILNNNENGELANYGFLYTAYTFGYNRGTADENYDDSAFSPDGWKIPALNQWFSLQAYVNQSGLILNTDHADWTAYRGNNMTGFSVFPSGRGTTDPAFDNTGNTSFIWATTNQGTDNSYAMRFRSDIVQNNQTGDKFCVIRMMRLDE